MVESDGDGESTPMLWVSAIEDFGEGEVHLPSALSDLRARRSRVNEHFLPFFARNPLSLGGIIINL